MPSAAISTVPNVAVTRAPKHRAEVIQQLLERYDDLTDPSQIRDQPGDGGGFLLMPRTYTPTVRELERLVCHLRDSRRMMRDPAGSVVKDDRGEGLSERRAWWHLNAWFLDVRRASFIPPASTARNKRKQLKRQPVDQHGIPLRQVRVFRKAEARYQVALQAVEWIAENWELVSEPMLPSELLAAA